MHQKIYKFIGCSLLSGFSGSWVISNFAIYRQIKVVKHVLESCCHLVVETGSWFILIKVLFTYLGCYYLKFFIKTSNISNVQKWLIFIIIGPDNLTFLQHFFFILNEIWWVPSSTFCGRIFSHVRPSYEWAVSDLDRSMNISLWV